MVIFQFILWLIALVTLILVVSIVLVSWKNGISPMPASSHVRQVVIQEVNRIPGYGNVIEAGSGGERWLWTWSGLVLGNGLRVLKTHSSPCGHRSCLRL